MYCLRGSIVGLLGLAAIGLVLAGDSERAPSAVPSLRFVPATLRAAVPPAGGASWALRWSYGGAEPARVLAWKAGCGCLCLDGLPARLRPGASGTCYLRVSESGGRRPRRHQVRVFTDAPAPHDVTVIRVSWGGDALRPASSARPYPRGLAPRPRDAATPGNAGGAGDVRSPP